MRPWVRLVLAISLDGRLAPPGGGAAQLGGSGDRRVLEESLAWADACLIGAGTLRAHRCTCLIRDADLLARRRLADRSEQPIAIVVSRSSGFSFDWPFFQQPLERWLLSSATNQAGFDEVVEPAATWPDTLNVMARKGVERLVLLGGAQLIASLLQDDGIDELQLTLTPRLLGGETSWIPFKAPSVSNLPAELSDSRSWALAEATPLGGDELLLRYQRRRGLGNR